MEASAELIAARVPQDKLVEFGDITKVLIRGWLIIAFATTLAASAAVGYLWYATPKYDAEMAVTGNANNQQTNASSALAAIGVPLVNPGQGLFDRFTFLLTSRAVAAELAKEPEIMRKIFADQWNPIAEAWEEPTYFVARAKALVKVALAMPPWHAPGPNDLQAWLDGNIIVDQTDPTITLVQVRHKDPVFAASLLHRLYTETDTLLRISSAEAERQRSSYLNDRITEETRLDQRNMLLGQLAQSQFQLTLAESGAPYSAIVVDPATVPDRPASPKAILILLVGIVGGAVLGSIYVLAQRNGYSR